jgi:hypothetical protein
MICARMQSGNRIGISSSCSVYPVSIIPPVIYNPPIFYSSVSDAIWSQQLRASFNRTSLYLPIPILLEERVALTPPFFRSSFLIHFINTSSLIHAFLSNKSTFECNLYQIFVLPGEITTLSG